jgi:transmembrane regulatory protein ToxS
VLTIGVYWNSNSRLEQVLISREWQSHLLTYISSDIQENVEDKIGPLSEINVKSNVKYLPNSSYLRVSLIELYGSENNISSRMTISESGTWELSDNYLLINPTEFKDISTNQNKDFSTEQQEIIKQIFIMDAEQSRRVDIINNNTILLTSLNHGSRILSSN